MANSQDLTTFIALFHHRDHTASAIRDLEAKGFSSSAMTVINGTGGTAGKSAIAGGNGADLAGGREGTGSGDGYGYGGGYGTGADLNTIGVPERDRKRLQDGLDNGGTVLMLEGEGARAEEINTIFHKYAEQIDDIQNDRKVAPLAAAAPIAAAAAIPPAPRKPNVKTDVLAGDSAVIPIVEEELVVGKREVDRGGVRVFSRVVEEPVQASVVLHEEHVVVDRRPVDRAVTEADLRGGDQVLELTETREEAVVGKTAKVVEEVLIGKQSSDRSETVRDSVRRTEVEVEEIKATTPIDKRSNDKF